MPIIKSASKRMIQSRKRAERLLPYRSHMKTMVKKVLTLAEKGQPAEAQKLLSGAYKAVDMAVKKFIIHRKTGDRKKSSMALAIARAEGRKKS